jgi:beta-phosphoglucomutase-like phosphatase (HAD superfamily)
MGRLDWMGRFDLVIFDCDGVLIDSERLAVRTEAAILSSLGWPLTGADIVARFVGRSAGYMHGEIERQLGRRVDWEAEFETRYRSVFERELVPGPGVIEALDALEQTRSSTGSRRPTTSSMPPRRWASHPGAAPWWRTASRV